MLERVGIVGLGAFGRFMAGHVGAVAREVVGCDGSGVETPRGVRRGTIADIAGCEVVIVAVPLAAMRGVLEDLAAAMERVEQGGQAGRAGVVVDVCSVKVEPVRLMREILPASVRVLGTHPLFGPQSGAQGIRGMPIAVCPVRVDAETMARARAVLEVGLGLRVIEIDAERHDRDMAYVQGLTHYISRALSALPLPETPLATMAYERLLAMRSNLAADSWALFETIQQGNAHAAEVRSGLRAELEALEERLLRRDG